MTHCSDEDLISYCYGEHRLAAAVEAHLDDCAGCRTAYQEIAAVLALVSDGGSMPAPARDEHYGLEVWQRIRHELPEQEAAPWRWWIGWISSRRVHVAALVLILVASAFVLGRSWPQDPVPAERLTDRAGERIDRARLAATADHLERAERVLLDVMNAAGTDADVALPHEEASALVAASRLYRDAATEAGDRGAADVLDDLERTLIDIAHGPPALSPLELAGVREQLERSAVLFKARVLGEELAGRIRRARPPAARVEDDVVKARNMTW